MSFHAGRPIRFELYSLAFAGLVVVVIVRDRMATYDKMFTELIKKAETPNVVQENNNNQTVIVESDRMRDILDRVKKMGENNVDGSATTAVTADDFSRANNGQSASGNDMPATSGSTSGSGSAKEVFGRN